MFKSTRRFLVMNCLTWRVFSLTPCLLVLAGFATAQEPAVTFEDVTSETGLQLSDGAACWADFDNDGWVDICSSGSVWKNNEGKSFTKFADIGASVAADFDNDGFIDLFSWSALKLYRNEGGKAFGEFELPELPKTVSRGACWGDFNGDGFVDLYVGGYEDWNAGITWPLLVLISDGGKGFRLDRSESKLRTRGVTACDFDQDGDVDVYASNYRLQPNLLWVNDGKGVFKEAAGEHGVVATSAGFGGGHSIGASWGDFNNDGQIDLFAGNFAHVDARGDQPKSRFLRNLGPDSGHKFQDLGPCGVHYQESYATTSAGDYDNDGNLDLFFTTVYGTASFGRKNNPVLFRSDGEFAVKDVTASANLAGLPPTYQAAWADYDNDGDLDLVSAGKLFQNQGSPNTWLKVNLRGDGKTVSRSAIAAQVRIKLGGKTLTRHVEAGTGEGNQNEMTLHFGLGQYNGPVDLEVFWPHKEKQTLTGVETNRRIMIDYKVSP
ncbi:MAG: CRTAC1 family protein [Planctomycetes bacterium]|nr:CRTAC1 family protein [Planctomycetota bacterium]